MAGMYLVIDSGGFSIQVSLLTVAGDVAQTVLPQEQMAQQTSPGQDTLWLLTSLPGMWSVLFYYKIGHNICKKKY